MYSITENRVKLSGEEFTTYSRKVEDSCNFEVEVGTNGYKGGEADKGSRTFFQINCSSNADVILMCNPGMEGAHKAVTIYALGDAELYGLVSCLKFAVKVLEDQIKEVRD